MNELQVINQQEVLGKDFKVYGTPDEPLFLAKDVAEWLEHTDSAKMIQSIDENEKLLRTLFVSGQNREVWFLTEDGLYEVLMLSRKPIAKQFKAKVKEILKDIRRHGMYATNELLDNPDLLIEAATRIKVQRQQIQQLEADKSALTVDLAIAQPKAAYFDELVDRNLLTGFRETAKLLKISEKKFVAFLIEHKYIYRDRNGKLCPHADKNNGLFEVKECYNEKTDWRGTQTLVTPKGRETFRLLCQGM